MDVLAEPALGCRTMASTPLEIAADGVTGRRLLAWPLFLVLFSFYLLGTSGRINPLDRVLVLHSREMLGLRRAVDIAERSRGARWGGIVNEEPPPHPPKIYATEGPGV